MSNSIVVTGNFIQTADVIRDISVRSDIDWFNLYNATTMGAVGADDLVQAYWQYGMPAGEGIVYYKETGTEAMLPEYIVADGFTRVDTSVLQTEALNATATRASVVGGVVRVLCTDTTTITDGDTVQLVNLVGGQQICGIPFTIGNINANTHFELLYSAGMVVADTNVTTGGFRVQTYDHIYDPRMRYIGDITQAAEAVIFLTETHNYEVGEIVKIVGTGAYAMTEINDVYAEITDVDPAVNTITINVDTTGFTVFAWPVNAIGAFTPAQVVPVGGSETITMGRTFNESFIGMRLGAALIGATDDEIYWQAGKSFG